MEIFCLEGFKDEFEKLKKNNSYSDLESVVIDTFFNKKPQDFFKSGSKITGSMDSPYIKKRLGGSGGYRCHYLLLIKDEKLYLMYIHPKTGSKGIDNTNANFEKQLYKEIYESIKTGNYYKLSVDKKSLIFTHNLLKEITLPDMEDIETIVVEVPIEKDTN